MFNKLKEDINGLAILFSGNKEYVDKEQVLKVISHYESEFPEIMKVLDEFKKVLKELP